MSAEPALPALQPVRLALWAMRCRFEVLIWASDPVPARAAGEEALEEIRQVERQLNFFSPGSEISAINRNAASQPVRVEPQLFELLQECRRLSTATGGGFDPTVTPLLECWGFPRGRKSPPREAELERARRRVGMNLVRLDPGERSVRFTRPGVCLNLGSIGKGYALDRAGAILRELAPGPVLLHGGTSSVLALGRLNGSPWPVSVAHPGGSGEAARLELEDEALGVSANSRNAVRVGRRRVGHVIDPRSGRPVGRPVLAAVVAASAAEADALSTALLATGLKEAGWLSEAREVVCIEEL